MHIANLVGVQASGAQPFGDREQMTGTGQIHGLNQAQYPPLLAPCTGNGPQLALSDTVIGSEGPI